MTSFLIKMSRLQVDSQKDYSDLIYKMQNDLESWLSHEKQLKEYRFAYQQNVIDVLKSEVERLKEEDKMLTLEEKEHLRHLKSSEKAAFEQLYEERKLDRLKEILLLEKESRLYLSAIHDLSKYDLFIMKLKESFEEGYDQYADLDYQEIMNELEHPQELFFCPQCYQDFYSKPNAHHDLDYIICPSCHHEFCSGCYHPHEDHYYDPDIYYECNAFCILKQYPQKRFHESKKVIFHIWPLKYQDRKHYSQWKLFT